MESDFEKFVNEVQDNLKQKYGQDIFDENKETNFRYSRTAHCFFVFKLEVNRLKKELFNSIKKSIIKLWKQEQ